MDVPRVLADTILAVARGSVTMHYGKGHECTVHSKLETHSHMKGCDQLSGYEKISYNNSENKNFKT
jgi:hypothetical protein